jgi:hypothetical protein
MHTRCDFDDLLPRGALPGFGIGIHMDDAISHAARGSRLGIGRKRRPTGEEEAASDPKERPIGMHVVCPFSGESSAPNETKQEKSSSELKKMLE